MKYEPQPNIVRIAHIFELMTSREVADAYTSARPGVQLVERSLTSLGQLLALLNNLLDVAILRVTAQMLADHPTGWHLRLLRLEPMQLVGRPGDPARATVSLHERPIEVFADAPGSGLYNVHGQYMTAFEQHTGLTLRWLGNPGTFGHCLAVIRRASSPAFLFEFDSYAAKYAEAGLPVHHPPKSSPTSPGQSRGETSSCLSRSQTCSTSPKKPPPAGTGTTPAADRGTRLGTARRPGTPCTPTTWRP